MKSLALKYRPATFEDVVEQGSTVSILKNQIKNGTFKQSVLFVGAAGTGKTTCARIFANEINDHKGSPIELDAASNNGVDDVREMSKLAQLKSTDSEYRVFIIDECHMFSAGAWAAMLKLIEEPPAKTVFILCTTDYWKIPKTIQSRCQRYDFKRISQKGIVSRLCMILDEEGYNDINHVVDDEPLEYIARLSDGCMREALQYLDKCLSYSSTLDMNSVVKSLGVFDYEYCVNLTNALLKEDKSNVISLIEDLYYEGLDMKQFVRFYMDFVLDIIKYGITGDITLTQLPNKEIAEKVDNEDNLLLKIMEMLVRLENAVKWSQNPKSQILAEFLTF